MLVLSRKAGERIHVGNDITIEIRRITGSRVTIAIAAPDSVRILRAELAPIVAEFRPRSDTATRSDQRPEREAAGDTARDRALSPPSYAI